MVTRVIIGLNGLSRCRSGEQLMVVDDHEEIVGADHVAALLRVNEGTGVMEASLVRGGRTWT